MYIKISYIENLKVLFLFYRPLFYLLGKRIKNGGWLIFFQTIIYDIIYHHIIKGQLIFRTHFSLILYFDQKMQKYPSDKRIWKLYWSKFVNGRKDRTQTTLPVSCRRNGASGKYPKLFLRKSNKMWALPQDKFDKCNTLIVQKIEC